MNHSNKDVLMVVMVGRVIKSQIRELHRKEMKKTGVPAEQPSEDGATSSNRALLALTTQTKAPQTGEA